MQNLISNPLRRSFGVSLATLLFAAFAGFSAPTAFADNADTNTVNDTVLVPRTVKGANAGTERVKRDSAQAKRYFASVARSNAPKSPNCPGTTCPKTRNCYDTKGSLGARCLTS